MFKTQAILLGALISFGTLAGLETQGLSFLVLPAKTHADRAEQDRYWSALAEPGDRFWLHQLFVKILYSQKELPGDWAIDILSITRQTSSRMEQKQHKPEHLFRIRQIRGLLENRLKGIFPDFY